MRKTRTTTTTKKKDKAPKLSPINQVPKFSSKTEKEIDLLDMDEALWADSKQTPLRFKKEYYNTYLRTKNYLEEMYYKLDSKIRSNLVATVRYAERILLSDDVYSPEIEVFTPPEEKKNEMEDIHYKIEREDEDDDVSIETPSNIVDDEEGDELDGTYMTYDEESIKQVPFMPKSLLTKENQFFKADAELSGMNQEALSGDKAAENPYFLARQYASKKVIVYTLELEKFETIDKLFNGGVNKHENFKFKDTANFMTFLNSLPKISKKTRFFEDYDTVLSEVAGDAKNNLTREKIDSLIYLLYGLRANEAKEDRKALYKSFYDKYVKEENAGFCIIKDEFYNVLKKVTGSFSKFIIKIKNYLYTYYSNRNEVGEQTKEITFNNVFEYSFFENLRRIINTALGLKKKPKTKKQRGDEEIEFFKKVNKSDIAGETSKKVKKDLRKASQRNPPFIRKIMESSKNRNPFFNSVVRRAALMEYRNESEVYLALCNYLIKETLGAGADVFLFTSGNKITAGLNDSDFIAMLNLPDLSGDNPKKLMYRFLRFLMWKFINCGTSLSNFINKVIIKTKRVPVDAEEKQMIERQKKAGKVVNPIAYYKLRIYRTGTLHFNEYSIAATEKLTDESFYFMCW